MVKFSAEELLAARRLKVRTVLFSEGTYQVEVQSVWPFLQLGDRGEILDAFCTCDAAESKGTCPHLAAAYLKIMGGVPEPLHVRFRESFWNQIAQIGFGRIGSDASVLKLSSMGAYEIYAVTGRKLLSLKPQNDKAKRRLKTLLFERPLETEETSLKFSKLSPEEIALWKQGRPSDQLRYELSFWSDLAKEWMNDQIEGRPYQLNFTGEEGLPHTLHLIISGLEIELYIAAVDWPNLIPSLAQVVSPLPVHSLQGAGIKAIHYLPSEKSFKITFTDKAMREAPTSDEGSIEVGNWLYFPGKGFYPKALDPLLQMDQIPPSKVERFLTNHEKLISKYLVKEKIHLGNIAPRYLLFISEDKGLKLERYAFEKGDLKQEGACSFGRWIYLPKKGFYHFEEGLFEESEQLIPMNQVGAFVSRHRVWLQAYEGFETHVSTIESRLGYRLNTHLDFYTRLDFAEDTEQIIDYGEWIYVRGKGFYARSSERLGTIVKAGLQVPPQEISRFIDAHKEELQGVAGFFALNCPLEKAGIEIGFNEKGEILVTPNILFAPGKQVLLFGDYTYVEKEGFAQIPPDKRLPESYRITKRIDRKNEPYFVGYELDLLYPYIINIDPRLKKPRECILHLDTLKRDPGAKSGEWIVDLSYQTNLGRVSPYVIAEALKNDRSYLFSDAGLLFLRQLRFEWFRDRKKKRWSSKGRFLRLSTLELLQLGAFEEIRGPHKPKSRELYEKFLSFQPPEPIDLTGLQSSLRPYQITGVNWLWFLSSYSLSGLLCDEMGLGKTHQAMALIAGLKNARQNKPLKILVVCPTSVIYHWEQLLERFFPEIRAYLFYGPQREWHTDFELILTSYGVLRSDRKDFQSIAFDLAVFDEIQVAKNEKSQVHQALVTMQANMRLGLTGTPIENRLLELKALFDIVLPNYLPGMAHFRDLFINPIEKHGDMQKKLLLKRLINPFILRRKKSEVLTELPEKIEEIATCDLSPEQQKLYREVFRNHEERILEQLNDPKSSLPIPHIFALLGKLKQVCDHPCLITKDIDQYKAHQSGKWDLFTELLSEIRDSGQKVVIFTQYLDMLDILGRFLKEEKIEYASIRGSTRDRKEQVAKFQEDPKCEVFLGSLQAAGVGIDLIAASVVIHYDRWWNPAKENQATDRVHRMGQKRGVQVFKLVTRHSVEEHIHRMIERKTALASGIIDFDSADQMKTLSRDELIELMQELRRDVEVP